MSKGLLGRLLSAGALAVAAALTQIGRVHV